MAQDRFETHDNGGRAFGVKITWIDRQTHKASQIDISKHVYEPTEKWEHVVSYDMEEEHPLIVFVGKSSRTPMTEFSGGFGSEFDGNSVLVCLHDSLYLFIGSIICLFSSRTEIVAFHSPVGNNDVPYPYAVDAARNFYLLSEYGGVVLIKSNVYRTQFFKNTARADAVSYYYDFILDDQRMSEFFHIKSFYIGGEKYTLKWEINPAQDFERFMCDFKRAQELGVSIEFKAHEYKNLTKKEYVALHHKFSKHFGVVRLPSIRIHDRP